jgi:hypothetical protein
LARSSEGINFAADALSKIFWYSPTFCTLANRQQHTVPVPALHFASLQGNWRLEAINCKFGTNASFSHYLKHDPNFLSYILLKIKIWNQAAPKCWSGILLMKYIIIITYKILLVSSWTFFIN